MHTYSLAPLALGPLLLLVSKGLGFRTSLLLWRFFLTACWTMNAYMHRQRKLRGGGYHQSLFFWGEYCFLGSGFLDARKMYQAWCVGLMWWWRVQAGRVEHLQKLGANHHVAVIEGSGFFLGTFFLNSWGTTSFWYTPPNHLEVFLEPKKKQTRHLYESGWSVDLTLCLGILKQMW